MSQFFLKKTKFVTIFLKNGQLKKHFGEKYHENKEFSSTEKDGRKKKKRKIGECNDVYLCTMFLISSILSIYLLRHILDNIYIETIICGCISIH
jgi:uncharacterized protein Veg